MIIEVLIEVAARLGFGALLSWMKGEGKRNYQRVIGNVCVGDIDGLVEECVYVFREKTGMELDVDDLVGSVALLNEEVANVGELFWCDGLGGYYAQVVGAYVGELLVRHGGGEWGNGPGGKLEVRLEEGESVRWMNPFEKFMPEEFVGPGSVLRMLSELAEIG